LIKSNKNLKCASYKYVQTNISNFWQNRHQKSAADGAVDEKVDGGVDDHEYPGDRVELVELQRRDVLLAGLDASDDKASAKKGSMLLTLFSAIFAHFRRFYAI
jgi:hypothetical protein